MPARKPTKRRTTNLGPKLFHRHAVRPHKLSPTFMRAGQPWRFVEPVELISPVDIEMKARALTPEEISGIASRASTPLSLTADDIPVPPPQAGGI